MASPLMKLSDQVFNENFLKDQAAKQPEEKPYNPLSEVERNRSQEVAITTGAPLDVVEAQREQGDLSTTVDAKVNGLNVDFAMEIDKAYNEGMSADDVANLIKQKSEKGEDLGLSEYMLIQNMMLGDNDVNPYAARTLTNMSIWNNLMTQAIEENDQTGISKILTFLDVNVLREFTIGAFENVTFRSNREGTDIREAFNSLKPEEFEEWAKEYIEERKDEGIFSEDSIWNLYKQANDATYLGDDPMAGWMFLFGGLDVATLGASRTVRAGATAAVQAGRTTIATAPEVASKLSSITKVRKPVDAVAVMADETEAAKTLGKMTDDVGAQTDQVNAGRALPEDLDPVKGPIERPSQAQLRDHTLKNRIIEDMETANRRGSFGEYLPRGTIEEVAKQTAEKITKRINNVVLNTYTKFDQGSDDYKIVVRMGKDGSGAAFRRKMDAEAIAKNDPSLRVVKKEQGRGWFIEDRTKP